MIFPKPPCDAVKVKKNALFSPGKSQKSRLFEYNTKRIMLLVQSDFRCVIILIMLFFFQIFTLIFISTGVIYEDDIHQTLPYRTPLCKVTITGATLLKSLEHSASMYDYRNCSNPENKVFGGFMHMSGKCWAN